MGGAVSAGKDNDELVDNLVEAEYVKTSAVEVAMRLVDRQLYYLEEFRSKSYTDQAWKNGNLHLSAPCIYAEVLESLELEKGLSFLNVGSGTGYLSTIVGMIIGGSGVNDGVELHADVVAYANERLDEFVKTSPSIDMQDFAPPVFVVGDCLQLAESSMGCYDRLYCGAAVDETQRNFFRSFVKVGGVLVMPFGDELIQMKRTTFDDWETTSVLSVSFASLICRNTGGADATISLPAQCPRRLSDLCRLRVRECVRRLTFERVPDAAPKRLTLTPKINNGTSHKTNTVTVRNNPFRRIVVPIFRTLSDEQMDEAEQAREMSAYSTVTRLQRDDDPRRQRVSVLSIENGQIQWERLFLRANEHDAVQTPEFVSTDRRTEAATSGDNDTDDEAIDGDTGTVTGAEPEQCGDNDTTTANHTATEPNEAHDSPADNTSPNDMTNTTQSSSAGDSGVGGATIEEGEETATGGGWSSDDGCGVEEEDEEEEEAVAERLVWVNRKRNDKNTKRSLSESSAGCEAGAPGNSHRRKKRTVEDDAERRLADAADERRREIVDVRRRFSATFRAHLLRLPVPQAVKDFLNFNNTWPPSDEGVVVMDGAPLGD